MDKVLIFGRKAFGQVETATFPAIDYIIEYHDFPAQKLTNISNLSEFSIIILDYDAFRVNQVIYQDQLDIFSRSLRRAINSGSYVIFVHSEEEVPKHDQYSSEYGSMNKDQLLNLTKSQIGFKEMGPFNHPLRPRTNNAPLGYSKSVVGHFDDYLDKWGSSKTYFRPYGTVEGLMPIQKDDDDYTGFAINQGRGKLLFMPALRNRDDTVETTNLIDKLIKSTLSFKAHTATLELPTWASEPIFAKEQELEEKLVNINEQKNAIEDNLKPYKEVKGLMFCSDDDFKNELVKFLENNMGNQIDSSDFYKNDFRLLGEKGVVLAAAEAKAINGGITKGAVYQLVANREEEGYDENIPGLLFVNQHLTATTWKGRDAKVDSKAYEAAAKENVLILRSIDIIRLWSLVDASKISIDDANSLILSSSGWLEINSEFKTILHPKPAKS